MVLKGLSRSVVAWMSVQAESGGGKGTAHGAELRAHGYEVQSQVIVDANGGTWKPLFKVWQPLSACYTPL